MDFKKRMRLAKYLKYAIVFCLILLFLWWGRNAVLRYWSQPLSTDISYKYGETQMGVQFPQVTLCQPSFYEDQIFMDCHNGSWNLLHTFASCMKTNKINPMQNFHSEIGNIVCRNDSILDWLRVCHSGSWDCLDQSVSPEWALLYF